MIQVLEVLDRLDYHTKRWTCPVVILRGRPQPARQVYLPINQKGFDFGSTTTPVTDQGYNPSIPTHTPVHRQRWNTVPRVPTSNHPTNTLAVSQLFDPMGYTDPSFITDIVQQECERLSSAAGGNQRVVPSFGPEEVGGE